MSPSHVQRQRTKGWTMPPDAVYVGRPTVWGNPWRLDDPDMVWWALAVGERGDEAGRRRGAVVWFRWWMTGGTPPIPSEESLPADGGEIEYSDGTIRKVSSLPVSMGLMMAFRDGPRTLPPRPDLAPLRGKTLVCWCPADGRPCHADVLADLAARPTLPEERG